MTVPIPSTETREHNSNHIIRLSTFRRTAIEQRKAVLVSLWFTREHGRHVQHKIIVHMQVGEGV